MHKAKKGWNLNNYYGIKKFLREFDKNKVLTLIESSMVMWSASNNNKAFEILIQSL